MTFSASHAAVALAVLVGSGTPSDNSTSQNATLPRNIANTWAKCVVQTNLPVYRAIVLAKVIVVRDPRDKSGSKQGDCLALAMGYGAGQSLSFPGPMRLFQVSQALVQIDYPSFDDKMKFVAEKLAAATEDVEGADLTADQAVIYNAAMLEGRCLLRAQPEQAYRLIMSGVGTDEERQSIASLLDINPECVDSKAGGIDSLRGALSLVLYTAIGAPQGASVAKLSENR